MQSLMDGDREMAFLLWRKAAWEIEATRLDAPNLDMGLIYFYLGRCYQDMRDSKEAERAWQKALTIIERVAPDHELVSSLQTMLGPVPDQVQSGGNTNKDLGTDTGELPAVQDVENIRNIQAIKEDLDDIGCIELLQNHGFLLRLDEKMYEEISAALLAQNEGEPLFCEFIRLYYERILAAPNSAQESAQESAQRTAQDTAETLADGDTAAFSENACLVEDSLCDAKYIEETCATFNKLAQFQVFHPLDLIAKSSAGGDEYYLVWQHNEISKAERSLPVDCLFDLVHAYNCKLAEAQIDLRFVIVKNAGDGEKFVILLLSIAAALDIYQEGGGSIFDNLDANLVPAEPWLVELNKIPQNLQN